MERMNEEDVWGGTVGRWRMVIVGAGAFTATLCGAALGLDLAGSFRGAAIVFDLLEFWCVTTAMASLAHGVWSSLVLSMVRAHKDAILRALASSVVLSGVGSLLMILVYLFLLDRTPGAADLPRIVALTAGTLPLQLGAVLSLAAQAKSMQGNPWTVDEDE